MVSTEESMASILNRLRAGFASHRTLNYGYRVVQLRTFKRALQENNPRIHEALVRDLARTEFQNEAELDSLMRYIDYCVDNLKNWMKPELRDLDMMLGPGRTFIIHEPFGVALIIGSWNFPFATTLNPLIAAIAAGNAALVKPSEMSSNSSRVIKELIQALDVECYQCVEGGPDVARALVSLKYDIIAFTGSPEKGKIIAEAGAKNLTPVILELGGKNPVYVDESADLGPTVRRIVQTRCFNAGQMCVSPEYVLVHSKVLDAFITEAAKCVKNFFGENPKQSPDLGRLVHSNHTQRIANLIENHSGRLICGGDSDVANRYIAPTIILNPDPRAPISQEEIFGPVLLVFTVKDIHEAITFINSREKPLAIYYYGRNSANKNLLMKETSSGNFSVNESAFHYAVVDIPFGGVGNSGTGSYFGKSGFLNFSHHKSVFEKGTLDCYPYSLRYPPHSSQKLKQFRLLKRLMAFSQNDLKRYLKYAAILVALVVLWKISQSPRSKKMLLAGLTKVITYIK